MEAGRYLSKMVVEKDTLKDSGILLYLNYPP